jgi:hypothetical protein
MYRRVTSDDNLLQFLPGVDDSEFIVGLRREPMFSRLYQRGFSELLWGNEMFTSHTDLNFKFSDDINVSINWGGPLISARFVGGSLWADYTKLSQVQFDPLGHQKHDREFVAVGYEIKSAIHILGRPTLQRFGQAWNPQTREKLDTYYMIGIPFNF